MLRLLDLAEFLFGPRARRDVFEPMLADRDRELAVARGATLMLRVRWAMAIARTFVMCTPDALTVRMPTVLLLDVLGCVGSFSIVALIFQLGASADLIQSEWKSTLIAALSFTVIPIVWRFRVAAIPEHQGRALTRTFLLVIGAAVLSLAAGEWAAGAAQVAGIIWLAFVGWRLGTDRAHVSGGPAIRRDDRDRHCLPDGCQLATEAGTRHSPTGAINAGPAIARLVRT